MITCFVSIQAAQTPAARLFKNCVQRYEIIRELFATAGEKLQDLTLYLYTIRKFFVAHRKNPETLGGVSGFFGLDGLFT